MPTKLRFIAGGEKKRGRNKDITARHSGRLVSCGTRIFGNHAELKGK